MRKRNKRANILVFRDLPLKYAPAANIGMLVLALVSGICSVIQVYVVSYFIDIALQSAQKMELDIQLFWALFLLMLTIAIDWLAPRIQNILRQKSELKLLETYRPALLEKCAKLELGFHKI